MAWSDREGVRGEGRNDDASAAVAAFEADACPFAMDVPLQHLPQRRQLQSWRRAGVIPCVGNFTMSGAVSASLHQSGLDQHNLPNCM